MTCCDSNRGNSILTVRLSERKVLTFAIVFNPYKSSINKLERIGPKWLSWKMLILYAIDNLTECVSFHSLNNNKNVM